MELWVHGLTPRGRCHARADRPLHSMAGRLAVFSAVLLSWTTLSPPVSGYAPSHVALRALPSGRAWHCPAGGALRRAATAPPILRSASVFPRRVGAARSGALGTRAAAERVEEGDVVKLHFTGTLDDGTVWDETRGDEPIEFKVKYRPSGCLRAVRALTSRLISLAGVKWSCVRIDKQAPPPRWGQDESSPES